MTTIVGSNSATTDGMGTAIGIPYISHLALSAKGVMYVSQGSGANLIRTLQREGKQNYVI